VRKDVLGAVVRGTDGGIDLDIVELARVNQPELGPSGSGSPVRSLPFSLLDYR
jgi:hypothetical protein